MNEEALAIAHADLTSSNERSPSQPSRIFSVIDPCNYNIFYRFSCMKERTWNSTGSCPTRAI